MAKKGISEKLRFLKQFISNPKQIGAIAPSSSALAQKTTGWIDWQKVGNVIEYGPGTGAFTGAILNQLQPGGRMLAVEKSPRMAQALSQRHPHLKIVIDDVRNMVKICEREEMAPVDVIISGLPWANFEEEMQEAMLRATLEVLAPSGYFATFAYNLGLPFPAARRFRHRLKDYFSEVKSSRPVWRNLPPAFVYQCRP